MSVLPFTKPKNTTLANDTGLLSLMMRALVETFDGNEQEFEDALAEALAVQIVELAEANDGFSMNLAEELADAMRGVLLQWLGQHSSCPREDLGLFMDAFVGPAN